MQKLVKSSQNITRLLTGSHPTQKTFEDKETQTIIQRKMSGETPSIRTDKEENLFYSLLEYTPFQEIHQTNINIVSLPRPHLQSSSSKYLLNADHYLLIDDDAISEMCLELKQRSRKGLISEVKTFQDAETQTVLHVTPHVLKEEQVALVTVDHATQTKVVEMLSV